MFWYEEEIKRLERERNALMYVPKTAFYGSSSIRLWPNIQHEFRDLLPVNLGFGGSTLAGCVWYFDRIFSSYNFEMLIIYAGDNDLGDGRHPEEVYIFFKQLIVKIRERFGPVPVFFISVKPSISRRNITNQIKYTNHIISKEIAKDPAIQYIDVYSEMLNERGEPNARFFMPDGLHLNEKGYSLWKEIVNRNIHKYFNPL